MTAALACPSALPQINGLASSDVEVRLRVGQHLGYLAEPADGVRNQLGLWKYAVQEQDEHAVEAGIEVSGGIAAPVRPGGVDLSAFQCRDEQPEVDPALAVELGGVELLQAAKPASVGSLPVLDGHRRPVAERAVVTIGAEGSSLAQVKRQAPLQSRTRPASRNSWPLLLPTRLYDYRLLGRSWTTTLRLAPVLTVAASRAHRQAGTCERRLTSYGRDWITARTLRKRAEA